MIIPIFFHVGRTIALMHIEVIIASDEKVSETLDNMLKDLSFFELDVDLQIAMTAYKVWCDLGKKDMDDDVTEAALEKQFKEWEKVYYKQDKTT